MAQPQKFLKLGVKIFKVLAWVSLALQVITGLVLVIGGGEPVFIAGIDLPAPPLRGPEFCRRGALLVFVHAHGQRHPAVARHPCAAAGRNGRSLTGTIALAALMAHHVSPARPDLRAGRDVVDIMAAERSTLYERAKARLKVRLVDVLDDHHAGALSGDQRQALEQQLRQLVRSLPEDFHALRLSEEDEGLLVREVFDEVVGYGPLDALLRDPTVSEVMVNGPHDIFVERNGRLQRVDATFRDTQHLMVVIERMLGTVGLSVNESSPLCDASLADGSRINVVIPPLVLNGPVVTIRRKLRDWTMADYVTQGALSEQAAEFLESCVKAKVNMVVSGGT